MNVENETENSSQQEQQGETTETNQETTETTATETENKSLIEGEKTETTAEEFVPLTAEDITFPEDFTVDEVLRDEALGVINNRELSPKEQLQALIDLQVKSAQTASEAISTQWTAAQEAQQAEVKADPTVGGAKLTDTLAGINKLVSEHGSPELLDVLAATGAGNNVHVIKFFHKVAGLLNEGKAVSAAAPTNQQSTAAERMFPSMKGTK